MTIAGVSGLGGLSEHLPSEISVPDVRVRIDEDSNIRLSPKLRADLLDLDAWGEILATYGRTMKVAVALTDSQGHILGKCHNEQPVWRNVRDAAPTWLGECPFCLSTNPCTAVEDALHTGAVVIVRDQAGLTHVAVPLLLGKHQLGAIIAGQVFDQYPDSLLLRHSARKFGVSAEQLWEVARVQRPVSREILRASGDLLYALGRAFLRQRYSAILEAKLAQTNRRFRLLVEGVKDHALFTMDLAGCVTSWNGGAEHLLGYAEDEIVGQNFSRIFTPEDIQAKVPDKQRQKALETGQTDDEGWRVKRTREQFWANINITALLDDAETVGSFAIIIQDVTERRKIAIALEEARQERSRLEAKLLSHVSHELRTPLTAIYLFTTNLLDGLLDDLTPEQHEHLTFVLNNVNQLSRMVNDLLDVTRAETFKLTVEPRRVSPAKLIAEVLATCGTNAAASNISLRSELAPNLPFLWADPVRVRQILTNLIDNGIKFTPENGTVTVKSQPSAEYNGFLCISVSDTGCGISHENREIIFNRLAQINSGTEISRSGLGLGLFIARELVSQHGGRIWVESRMGSGSTFYFTLPVISLARLCAHVFAAPNLEGGSVTLIVVDVTAAEGAVQRDILAEIRGILERCIHPAQDMLLPSMDDSPSSAIFFIVAWADAKGFAVIASRIAGELQKFGTELKAAITSTTLLVTPNQSREEQISEVTVRIEQLIQTYILSKETL